ncbi:THUMP domain-containing class I SAM-dependent RNA methyltransferase [Geoalkalibacter halelectricus]|uniref:Class I SAM-dependent RNA methyltransferase n=1 Tax=Geoalkalibacter halelectricus TaxID=2847045 RepID=A0ABY5ZI48_9BACT|nr:class I SAM-dependent RNA methyltransferase [Geoalkalibacter halelectricus]MDO3379013.1 class I SAM-dependent RNA methyltransferase [Geoalkalibacter halelectricus]UWZ78827.1 class I SAM-dependent RNA methyltransferase [Geoalkalibacter halelectricus]
MSQSLYDLFAVTAPGCEAACLAELNALGLPGLAQPGGVAFRGELADIYRANLWLRTAARVLVRFAELRATSFPELYQKCVRLPWGRFVRPRTAVAVRVSCRRSRLMHTGRITQTLGAAVDRALGREKPPAEPQPQAVQLVLVRFEEDRALISLDSSGELLHRRGYRQEQGAAPLRETLAAALLHEVGWQPHLPLWDPMCGSGTLLIEAALVACRGAPGLQRGFAFENWPRFRAGRWQVLLGQAQAAAMPSPSPTLYGSERDAALLAAARRNAERAGVADVLALHAGDFRDLPVPPGPGVVLCNPPYGLRIGESRALRALFADFGDFLRTRAPGWRGGFLLPDSDLARASGLALRPGAVFAHGGLAARLHLFSLS